jgi:hypothetical protein
MKLRISILQISILIFCLPSSGQNQDSIVNNFAYYLNAINNFSRYIPQEKVYLHFDNTSYYQGDIIWFKCYVENSDFSRSIQMSKTLYVELLNPGGEIIDKRILKIENGQCHGDFPLLRMPFYSGFYEVRAYTKYMLNFGEDAIFSRLLPVFDKPKTNGAFEEKSMMRYVNNKYPMVREKLQKEKKVNLKFFPEGGNLVSGIESQVAFEVMDEFGNPINITGSVIGRSKEEITHFNVTHEGRGVFAYTPGTDKPKTEVIYEGKKYQFDMPAALPKGIVMKIDNLSYPDSIGIMIQKSRDMSDCMYGLITLNKGKMQNYCIVNIPDSKVFNLKIDKTKLSHGVSQIIMFDMNGEILCDRLIFSSNNHNSFDIRSKTEKSTYKPHELVEMEFSVTDKNESPVTAPFSLSIRDGMNEIEHKHNIMTYFLLMSEIKGYVRNPSYYFESDDDTRRSELDLLMMVQGWRRHLWKQMAGVELVEIFFLPEQGIETSGQVVSLVRSIPKPNVDVSLFLTKKGVEIEEKTEDAGNFFELFKTDSLGRFYFVSDVYDKWNMILSVMEKGKIKDHRIVIDRLFSPDPKKYDYKEMHADIVVEEEHDSNDEEIEDIVSVIDSIFLAEEKGIDKTVIRLAEVTVTAKKRSRENDILNNRSKSVAYYDVNSEIEDIKDNNIFIGDDIHELMLNMNKDFTRRISGGTQHEFLRYKSKIPLFVINYERTNMNEMDYFKYKLIRLEAIKSIYINETLSIMHQYADIRMSSFDVADIYSCVVFIETYPEEKIPASAGKGTRKTRMEGYSRSKEFYNPDYSEITSEPDYRRTLYWNPSVTPNDDGKVTIQFYNNSRCNKFSISAESITSQGVTGIYQNK